MTVYRRIKYSGVALMLVGVLMGFAVTKMARLIIWVITGFLATWLILAGTIQQRRYQRVLDRLISDDDDSARPGQSKVMRHGDTSNNVSGHDRSLESSPTPPLSSANIEKESLRITVLHRYEHFFAHLAFVGIGITIVGIAVSFLFSDGARAAIIGALGAGGLWIAVMSLIMRKRIRTRLEDHQPPGPLSM